MNFFVAFTCTTEAFITYEHRVRCPFQNRTWNAKKGSLCSCVVCNKLTTLLSIWHGPVKSCDAISPSKTFAKMAAIFSCPFQIHRAQLSCARSGKWSERALARKFNQSEIRRLGFLLCSKQNLFILFISLRVSIGDYLFDLVVLTGKSQ